jgi:excisionase family DNA binding protein
MQTPVERRGGNPSVLAKSYGCADRVIRDLIRDGAIRSHKIGGKTVILFSDFEDYVRQQPAPVAWRKRPKQETFPCLATL